MDAEGCEECHGSGIAGRIGAFEMIEIGREERQIIRGGFSADKLQEE